ncbi:MAG: hypothetical protein AAGI44_02335 [Pseudomonadota bacterium]
MSDPEKDAVLKELGTAAGGNAPADTNEGQAGGDNGAATPDSNQPSQPPADPQASTGDDGAAGTTAAGATGSENPTASETPPAEKKKSTPRKSSRQKKAEQQRKAAAEKAEADAKAKKQEEADLGVVHDTVTKGSIEHIPTDADGDPLWYFNPKSRRVIRASARFKTNPEIVRKQKLIPCAAPASETDEGAEQTAA